MGEMQFFITNYLENTYINTSNGTHLEEVDDFKYLDAWMACTEKDIQFRKAAAWRACNKRLTISRFSLPRSLKLWFFTATVESVLLYGCETWTLSSKLAKGLDGMYTRMLRPVVNVHWSQHITNKIIYGDLPKLYEKIRKRRIRFAGHCSRSSEEPVSYGILANSLNA